MKKINLINIFIVFAFYLIATFIMQGLRASGYAEEENETNTALDSYLNNEYFYQTQDIELEADYILSCQYINASDPAHGAINNIYGDPTWIVPRENALAVLGLIEASDILGDSLYLSRAQLAADYLVSVQDPSDGAWYDQYNYTSPAVLSKSPTQTTEVMIALYKLGYDQSRYDVMKKGAQYLFECQDPTNKGGNDDGLLGGGKDETGVHRTWRWASDNSFAYWALKAAQSWAIQSSDFEFAILCEEAANDVLNGINNYMYVDSPSDPDYGVWRRAVDEYDNPVEVDFHEWINYSPQMLDVPVIGVGSTAVGDWIHNNLQSGDGALITNDDSLSNRKSPGFSFQASFCWQDLGQNTYSDDAINWVINSGLWQITTDPNGIEGGWIDWVEGSTTADWWLRFIDTSFYAIAAFSGGYDFSTASSLPNTTVPQLSAIGNKNVNVGATLSFDVTANDNDDNHLLWIHPLSAELPGGASFTVNEYEQGYLKARFQWSPQQAQIGAHNIMFEVSDGQQTDFEEITINVSEQQACFIATAAYESSMAKDVNTLKAFRDRYLMTNELGREFVKLYYKYSPPLAAYISDKPKLRTTVRAMLKPLVLFSEMVAK